MSTTTTPTPWFPPRGAVTGNVTWQCLDCESGTGLASSEPAATRHAENHAMAAHGTVTA